MVGSQSLALASRPSCSAARSALNLLSGMTAGHDAGRARSRRPSVFRLRRARRLMGDLLLSSSLPLRLCRLCGILAQFRPGQSELAFCGFSDLFLYPQPACNSMRLRLLPNRNCTTAWGSWRGSILGEIARVYFPRSGGRWLSFLRCVLGMGLRSLPILPSERGRPIVALPTYWLAWGAAHACHLVRRPAGVRSLRPHRRHSKYPAVHANEMFP